MTIIYQTKTMAQKGKRPNVIIHHNRIEINNDSIFFKDRVIPFRNIASTERSKIMRELKIVTNGGDKYSTFTYSDEADEIENVLLDNL